jgi:hypothetical protein
MEQSIMKQEKIITRLEPTCQDKKKQLVLANIKLEK